MLLRIKRYDGEKSYIQEYKIDVKKDETLLEVLDKINRTDRTLTYRSFCRSSICGTCAVRVNGRSVLACKVKAADFGEELFVEALKNCKIIKDLVVDHSYIEKSINNLQNYFESTEKSKKSENIQTPDEHKVFDKQTDCIMCMACYSECEALDYDKNFAGPFAFTKTYRFVFDSRDGNNERVSKAVEHSLNSCVGCQRCYFVCPKGISSMNDIKMLQMKAPKTQNEYLMENFF